MKLTAKLEKIGRSALPLAVRGTLNDAAFKMKTEKMPKSAGNLFVNRSKNFFKANSKFESAQGMEMGSMKSTVGFYENKLQHQSTNYAVKDLRQQEYGGVISGRSYKPLSAARSNGRGLVKPNERLRQIRLKAGNIVNAKDSKGKNKMQKMIKAAVHAGVGGYVLGGNLLFKVTRIKRLGGGNIQFKKQKLYSFKKDGTAKVVARGFMRIAALETQKEMSFYYKLQAQKQIAKVLK